MTTDASHCRSGRLRRAGPPACGIRRAGRSATSRARRARSRRQCRPRTPTPAASVTNWTCRIGRAQIDRYSPAPGGEFQLRPRRPRPAVCRSATPTNPAAAPAAPRTRPRRSWMRDVVPPHVEGEIGRRAVSRQGLREVPRQSLQRLVQISEVLDERRHVPHARDHGLELEADVRCRRGMRQRADRHEIRAGRCQLRDAIERHAAGDLDAGAAARCGASRRGCRRS